LAARSFRGMALKHIHVISRSLAAGLGLAAALLGIAGLAGWFFDLALLKAWSGGHAAMKPNLALGFVAAGLSLFAYTALPRADLVSQVLRRGGGSLAGLIGLLT